METAIRRSGYYFKNGAGSAGSGGVKLATKLNSLHNWLSFLNLN